MENTIKITHGDIAVLRIELDAIGEKTVEARNECVRIFKNTFGQTEPIKIFKDFGSN